MSIANKQGALSSKQIDRCKLLLGTTSRSLLGNSGDIMGPLIDNGGIVFENTPTISAASTMSYVSYELMHTNYDLTAYQKTSVTDFQIQAATLTAETTDRAEYMLAVIHFLRTFSKMNYGISDPNAGMPPRILKFYAYGEQMFHGVPVALKSYTIHLPNNVDYVQTKFNTQVPLMMEININMSFMPTPSRLKREFSLQKFANGSLIKKGYL